MTVEVNVTRCCGCGKKAEAALSSDVLNETIAKAICKSGKFETGEGTCAVLCMDQLGSARRNCPHATRVHAKLAEHIAATLSQLKESSNA